MYDLENALAIWKEVCGQESAEERLIRSQRWLSYYAYLAKKALQKPPTVHDAAKQLSAFMVRENILHPEDTLLDVGAGMGSHSLAFAEACKAVSALDMNADCLSVLKRNAEMTGKSNITAIAQPWEQYSGAEQFDVVFSAMCPAICNEAELQRFESLSRRTACILTVTRGSYEKQRMELMRAIPHEKPKGMVTEALHYYNVLYLMGRQPNIKTWQNHLESEKTVEELVEQYSVYLTIFGVSKETSLPLIHEFFAKRAENGIVHDECQMNTALIYWDVPEK